VLLGYVGFNTPVPWCHFNPRRLYRRRCAQCTYRNHGTHAEAIKIVFDPQELSYRKLLECFFQIRDPTTLNRQGNDRGTSYRSAIFYTSEEQKRIATATIADSRASLEWVASSPP
jgi:peptide-methionine (S)-S-oxide reductase